MFCGNCGSQIPEDASSCTNCGAPVKSASPAGKMSGFLKSFNYKDPKSLGIAAVALVAVVALVFMLFGSGSYEKVVDNFIDAVFDANGKQVLSVFPDEFIDYLKYDNDMSKSELIREISDELADQWEDLSDFGKPTFSHKILETESADSDDLIYLNDKYSILDIKIKDAKLVTVEVSYKTFSDSDSDEIEFYVIKIGGTWYIEPSAFYDLV